MPLSNAFTFADSIADLPHGVIAAADRWVEQSFDDLHPFEIVQNQYSDRGIHFYSAIALQPTNASFPVDRMGIMPMGNQMKLAIAFAQPPCQIRLRLTGAGPIHATLLDAYHRPIVQPLSQSLPALPAALQAATRNSAASPLPFPQYELNFSAIGELEQLQTSHSPLQIYRIDLEAALPFVLQMLAIARAD